MISKMQRSIKPKVHESILKKKGGKNKKDVFQNYADYHICHKERTKSQILQKIYLIDNQLLKYKHSIPVKKKWARLHPLPMSQF